MPLCWCRGWQMVKWKIYLVQARQEKFFCWLMYAVFLKITTFLWIILILHPGHTSLFHETVTIKFIRPRAEGRGPRKTNTRKAAIYLWKLFFKILRLVFWSIGHLSLNEKYGFEFAGGVFTKLVRIFSRYFLKLGYCRFLSKLVQNRGKITLQQRLLRKILVGFFGQKYEKYDCGKWKWNLGDLFLKIGKQTFFCRLSFIYLC